MGEAKNQLIEIERRDMEERDHQRQKDDESFETGNHVHHVPKPNPSAYDPDHLNPAKGGNKAADDYWD